MDAPYVRYTFRGHNGYLIGPAEGSHGLVAVGHTAAVPPWTDPGLHLHQQSEEFYILLQGELGFVIAGNSVTLKPHQILMVKPGVPHAIVRGRGLIEHVGLRAPALGDKRVTGPVPHALPAPDGEGERDLVREWGCRLELTAGHNQNTWLFGYGNVKHPSAHLILAYLDFPTEEAANAGIGTRHRLHLHRKSWEYYLVREGVKTLQVEDELVTATAGEILALPPGVRHALAGRQAPYRGFTFRVPLPGYDDKVEF